MSSFHKSAPCRKLLFLIINLKPGTSRIYSSLALAHLLDLGLTLVLSGECMFLGFCLITTKIWSDGHQSPRHVVALRSWTDHVTALRSRADCVIALRQISVTALLYLDNSRKIHPWGMSACWPKDAEKSALVHRRERERERKTVRSPGGERERALAPLSICCFLPLGLRYVNWASQERCLFYLKSSLQSSDLPLFYFHGLFSSLSFSHRHSGLLFPILTTNSSFHRLKT